MVGVRTCVEVGPSEAVPSGCGFVPGGVREERWAVPVWMVVWAPVEAGVGVGLVVLAVDVYGLGD